MRINNLEKVSNHQNAKHFYANALMINGKLKKNKNLTQLVLFFFFMVRRCSIAHRTNALNSPKTSCIWCTVL